MTSIKCSAVPVKRTLSLAAAFLAAFFPSRPGVQAPAGAWSSRSVTANATEGLYEPFEIPGSGVVVPAGTYEGWESALVFFTDQSRAGLVGHPFQLGRLPFRLQAHHDGRPDAPPRRAHASAGLRLSYNDVMLPEGDFTATFAGLNAGWFFTPRVYLQSPIQYSDQIDTWSANIRFGCLNTAGTGLFIVYNDVQDSTI